MAKIIDNLLAFRILYMLVTPFEETAAFKFGIIDKNGVPLKKMKDLTTSEERDSYTYLNKLVFTMKRLIGKLPGGKTQLASIVAAYYLIKESYETNTKLTEERYQQTLSLLENNFTLVEEQIIVEKFLRLELTEDGIANVAGAAVATDKPVVRLNKKNKPVSGIIELPNYVARRNKPLTPMG
jgi:hypothetical protein